MSTESLFPAHQFSPESSTSDILRDEQATAGTRGTTLTQSPFSPPSDIESPCPPNRQSSSNQISHSSNSSLSIISRLGGALVNTAAAAVSGGRPQLSVAFGFSVRKRRFQNSCIFLHAGVAYISPFTFSSHTTGQQDSMQSYRRPLPPTSLDYGSIHMTAAGPAASLSSESLSTLKAYPNLMANRKYRQTTIIKEGILDKWTNYVGAWRAR